MYSAEFLFVLFLSIPFLAACIFLLILAHRVRELRDYLARNHKVFFDEIIDTPYLAGDFKVLERHFRAFKVTFWGEMPDDVSHSIQSRIIESLRSFLFSFIIFTVVTIVLSILGYYYDI